MISVKKIILLVGFVAASLILKAQIPCDTNFLVEPTALELADWKKSKNNGFTYSAHISTDTIDNFLYLYFYYHPNDAYHYTPNMSRKTHRISYNCDNKKLTFFYSSATQLDPSVIKNEGYGGVYGIQKIDLEKTPVDTIVEVYREWFFAEGCSRGKTSFDLTHGNSKEVIPCSGKKDWLLDGVYHKSQNNKDIMTGNFKNGYRIGKWFEYDSEGLVNKIINYNTYGEIIGEINPGDVDWPYGATPGDR